MASWVEDPLPEEFGRYRILKILGHGGMGVVYLARDTQLDREVALKVPHFDAARPKLLERFEQEARAAARVHHPNICAIHDVGEIDGRRYLTMAFIDGTPLSKLLRQGKRVIPRQGAYLVRKLALAVQEAHQCGVIHRDLKPSNVMIDRRGQPIIMDFGLARRYRSADARLTRVGAGMGTPAYMAPETCRGAREALGPACDVYSLGVMLYELLTGRLPFSGDDVMAILSKVLVEEPPPPSTVRADIEPELERICLKAMAKKPEERYPSAAALAADLRTYVKSGAATTSAPTLMVPILLDEQEPDTESDTGSSRATKVGVPPPLPGDVREDWRAEEAEPPDEPLPQLRRRWRMPIGLTVAGAALLLAPLLVALPIVGYVIYRVTDVGTCRIELSDANAMVSVRVDGNLVDVNAADGLRLAPGAHELEVVGKDYDPVQMPFMVHRGNNSDVRVPLVLKLATVTVTLSDPVAEVQIKIDGQAGYRHGQVVRLAARQAHVVEASGAGYEDVRHPFTLEPGAVLTMTIHLRKPGMPDLLQPGR